MLDPPEMCVQLSSTGDDDFPCQDTSVICLLCKPMHPCRTGPVRTSEMRLPASFVPRGRVVWDKVHNVAVPLRRRV